MDKNYYDVKFMLSNDKVRVVSDVRAYTAEEAISAASTYRDEKKIVVEKDKRTHYIFRKHLTEIIVEKVLSPDERDKQK